jgi:hypothetical protein
MSDQPEDDSLTTAINEGQARAARGDRAGAGALWAAAWARAMAAGDGYAACVAAHLAAHMQEGAAAQRDWHERALRGAEAAAPARVVAFYPSLRANLAEVCLRLGDRAQAQAHLRAAQEAAPILPDDAYGASVRLLIDRVAAALAVVAAPDC